MHWWVCLLGERHDGLLVPDGGWSVQRTPAPFVERRTSQWVDSEWRWGLGFRPLEHFLTDRKGRQLDGAQIAMFQSAITAVRGSIALGPDLDAALADVLAQTLELKRGHSRSGQLRMDDRPKRANVRVVSACEIEDGRMRRTFRTMAGRN